MKRRAPVVAIDGPSGVGKTTVAKFIAKSLGFTYVDTGAMYRVFALGAKLKGIDMEDEAGLKAFSEKVKITFGDNGERILLDGRDFTSEIRRQYVGELASVVSSKKVVRDFLVGEQRRLGGLGPCVMEGRDIGTVVFPDAVLKIFLDAKPLARAKRRHAQIKGVEPNDIEEVSREIRTRDRRDSERTHSPLKKAQDAIYVDTSELSLKEVEKKILDVVKERLGIGDISS